MHPTTSTPRPPPGAQSPPPYSAEEHRPPSVHAVWINQTSQEHTPLLRFSKPKSTDQRVPWLAIALSALVFLVIPLISLTTYHSGYASALDSFYNPRVREDIRKQWFNEVAEHDIVRSEWRSESDAHRRAMAEERRQAEEERTDWELARQRREEEQRREEDEWRQKMEDMRRREEDERIRLVIKFSDPKPQNACKSYGTREYYAQLTNVPNGYDGMRACYLTPVVINGVAMDKPTWCEKTDWGGILGHWDFTDESACKPFFSWFKDKGCSSWGSRKRRFESPLENMYTLDHWEQVCSSTPADFNGMHFDRPSSCAHWGSFGVWGIWFVDDQNC